MSGEEAPSAMALLMQHLRGRERSGQTHVWLSGAARDVMRAWHLSLKGGKGQRGAAGPAKPGAGGAERRLSAPAAAGRAVTGPQGAAPTAAAGADAWPSGEVDPALAAALAGLRDEVSRCGEYARLREQGHLRDTLVFSVGNPASPLVLVGEAPGEEEEKLGEPFVGPAGQLLTKMLTAMGLQRSQVYITNIVKYRPAITDGAQGSKNRRPTPEEIAVGLPHLRRELAVLRPKVLVALGATALEGLAGEAIPIGRARGQWRTFEGIPLMPTFHPSYLLRNEALSERRKVWEDLLQVMEKLGLPISAKQRAFFKG